MGCLNQFSLSSLNGFCSAEVGLLSHNVIVQGSLLQSDTFEGLGADKYGGHILIHRTGPHPTPIRYVGSMSHIVLVYNYDTYFGDDW